MWSCAATSSSVFGRLRQVRIYGSKSDLVGTYYFSTQGCCRFVSSLASLALGLELLDAAAAARALLLKKVEAICTRDSGGNGNVTGLEW